MKKLILSATLLLCVTTAQALTVMIDPGHGGHDDGAVRAGVKESQIVLSVSQLLAKHLEQDPSFNVHLTRTTDRFLSLGSRVKEAESKKVDLFLSIHANAAESPKAYGVEFFFQNQLPPEEEALFLANRENKFSDESTDTPPQLAGYSSDVRAILDDLRRNHRILESYDLSQVLLDNWGEPTQKSSAIRQAPFYVLTQTQMPAVLVELGFVTNGRERRKMTDQSHQAEMAKALYQALVKYKEKLDKTAR